MVTQPTPITDKNGKQTTVHKKSDGAPKSTRKLPQPAAAEAATPVDAVEPTHEFDQSDYTRIIAAFEEVGKFKEFVLNRFKKFAAVHEDMDVDAEITRGGGYVRFKVDNDTLFDDNKQEIVIYKKTSGERYDDGMTKAYRLPKVFLFQNSEEEADYESFISLKKKFFGTKP